MDPIIQRKLEIDRLISSFEKKMRKNKLKEKINLFLNFSF